MDNKSKYGSSESDRPQYATADSWELTTVVVAITFGRANALRAPQLVIDALESVPGKLAQDVRTFDFKGKQVGSLLNRQALKEDD